MSSLTGSSASAIAAASGFASVITTFRPSPCAMSTAGTCSRPPHTIRMAFSGIAAQIFRPLRIHLRDRTHVEPDVEHRAVDAGNDRMLAKRKDRRVPVLHDNHI